MTNRRSIAILFLPIVLFSVGGCIPFRFTQTPGAKGTVVDALSKVPIQGAVVSLMSAGYGAHPENNADMRTATDGRFEIAPKKQWGPYILGDHPAPRHAYIRIKAHGYIDVERDISIWVTGPSMTDLGLIPMIRFKQ